jgi:hypothetical protein
MPATRREIESANPYRPATWVFNLKDTVELQQRDVAAIRCEGRSSFVVVTDE